MMTVSTLPALILTTPNLWWALAAVALLLFVIAPLLDRYIFPEDEPGEEFVPQVGQVFHSDAEGFTMRVLRREDGLLWVEVTMQPHAAGPPPHMHLTFSERFRVERGRMCMRVGDAVHELREGEEILIEPGVVHQPFNASDEPAVVYGSTRDHALPERFGVFLTQVFGFFNAHPEAAQPPRVLLQMSRFSPAFDSWLGGPPIVLQKALFWTLGPIARVFGYRTYYPQYAPRLVSNPQAASREIAGEVDGGVLTSRTIQE